MATKPVDLNETEEVDLNDTEDVSDGASPTQQLAKDVIHAGVEEAKDRGASLLKSGWDTVKGKASEAVDFVKNSAYDPKKEEAKAREEVLAQADTNPNDLNTPYVEPKTTTTEAIQAGAVQGLTRGLYGKVSSALMAKLQSQGLDEDSRIRIRAAFNYLNAARNRYTEEANQLADKRGLSGDDRAKAVEAYVQAQSDQAAERFANSELMSGLFPKEQDAYATNETRREAEQKQLQEEHPLAYGGADVLSQIATAPKSLATNAVDALVSGVGRSASGSEAEGAATNLGTTMLASLITKFGPVAGKKVYERWVKSREQSLQGAVPKVTAALDKNTQQLEREALKQAKSEAGAVSDKALAPTADRLARNEVKVEGTKDVQASVANKTRRELEKTLPRHAATDEAQRAAALEKYGVSKEEADKALASLHARNAELEASDLADWKRGQSSPDESYLDWLKRTHADRTAAKNEALKKAYEDSLAKHTALLEQKFGPQIAKNKEARDVLYDFYMRSPDAEAKAAEMGNKKLEQLLKTRRESSENLADWALKTGKVSKEVSDAQRSSAINAARLPNFLAKFYARPKSSYSKLESADKALKSAKMLGMRASYPVRELTELAKDINLPRILANMSQEEQQRFMDYLKERSGEAE